MKHVSSIDWNKAKASILETGRLEEHTEVKGINVYTEDGFVIVEVSMRGAGTKIFAFSEVIGPEKAMKVHISSETGQDMQMFHKLDAVEEFRKIVLEEMKREVACQQNGSSTPL